MNGTRAGIQSWARLRGVTPQTAATRDLGSAGPADHMMLTQIVS
ncbi:hypothetical protein ACVILH_001755 [Bradyrhizobium sp. USDA 4353]